MADELSHQAINLESEFQKQHGEKDQIIKIVELIEKQKRKLTTIFSSSK